ncbi:MAG: Ig-like domain-containing protein [bacterium]|nr:Ig-like domain-containing protein [bacterium]
MPSLRFIFMAARALLILFLVLFPLFPPVQAETTVENAGFAPQSIWYSKDPFFAGERVTIHTIVVNSGSVELSGTVEFYDGETLLGRASVTVPPGGSFAEASVPWKVTEGRHTIFALLKDVKVGGNVSVALENSRTGESEKFVAAAKAAAATSTALGYVEEKLAAAKSYAEEKLPAPVVEAGNAAAAKLEAARATGQSWADAENEKAKEIIREMNEAKPSAAYTTGSTALKKPFAYAREFFTSLLGSVFANAYIFYGVLLILLFFVLRFVKRIFFF